MVGGAEAKECWGVVWTLRPGTRDGETARYEGQGTGDEGSSLSS
jgi:hypothetical protein